MAIDEYKEKLNVAQNTLNLSYKLITHYDSKTNQLLTLIGFDFVIVSAIIAILFDKSATISNTIKVVALVLAMITYVLISISVWKVRGALMPHVNHIGKIVKPKAGLLYFMDIKNHYGEDDYVGMLIGNRNLPESKFYSATDTDAYEKCIIEDCARDIYAHAEILQVKTKFVKDAFNYVFTATIFSIITVGVIGILFVSGL